MTSTKSPQIERISALAELERIGWAWEAAGGSEIRLKCPAHDDASPSASLNTEKNLWRCHVPSCEAKGDIVSFVALALRTTRYVVLTEMSSRYDLSEEKVLDPRLVESFHARLGEAGPLLAALRERGITDEMMRAARLGYHDGRITIPVIDADGRVWNILRYLPGAPGPRKMRNTRGHSKLRLYQSAHLARERVWLCGGPMKALLVGALLDSHGVGAVSSTGGEGSWDPNWGALFAGKEVWVCMDVDAAGVAAARRYADHLAPHAKAVRVIALPLDPQKYPKGDVNDLVGREAGTAETLLDLMRTAASFDASSVPAVSFVSELGRKRVEFTDLGSPSNIGWRVEAECMATAVEETPFLIPRLVSVRCDRAQPNCKSCPISMRAPDEASRVEMEIAASSPSVMSLANSSADSHRKMVREALGIPRCKSVEFTTKSHRAVREVRVSPQLSIASSGSGNASQPALVVDAAMELSAPYIARGRIYPHPGTQRAYFVIDELEESVDSLTAFEPTQEELESLEFFQPREWTVEAVKERLTALYEDLEANVTRIYGRRELHLVIDVAYHSPVLISLGDREIGGWGCVVVAGDTAQGKSETSERLMEHYGLGERVDCKNASVAGLLGGVQQVGSKWFVVWGALPMHDRRLVILEELKGASTEVIAKLTEVRSSGVAQIPKIEKRKANARTRLVMISNPRSGRAMSTYSFGVEVLRELLGAPEDLRRVDLAIALRAGAVSLGDMYTRRTVPHTHTSDLCRRLVLWAWTLNRGEAYLDEGALRALAARRDDAVQRYDDVIPLVDAGTIEQKLARVAAGIAARTFSADADHRLVVREAHVAVAYDLMRRLYDDEAMKYGELSAIRRRMRSVTDKHVVEDWLRRQMNADHLVKGLHEADLVTKDDVADYGGLDLQGAQQVVSFLVRTHCLRRVSPHSYAKNPDFVTLLRELYDGEKKLEPVSEDM